MASRLRKYKINRKLSVFDSTKYPVRRAKNGVPYMDIPALGFYRGTHKGQAYSAADIASLEATFIPPDPSDELGGTIPVMVDHSESNRDKIGHFRSVRTINGESHLVLRIVGEQEIEDVKKGKYRSLSAGILVSWDDSQPAVEPEDETAELSEEYPEELPAELSEEYPEELPAEMADEDPDGDGDNDIENPDESGETHYGRRTCAYDHIAFTPFPALTDCRIYNQRGVKKVKKSTRASAELEQLRNHTAALKQQMERERAQFAAEKQRLQRKNFATAETERLITAGKATPAQRDFLCQFISTLEPVQVEAFSVLMNSNPTHAYAQGTIGVQEVVKPNAHNPLSQAVHNHVDAEAAALFAMTKTGQRAAVQAATK